ncbi:unnamed protein product [Soboliphyme baturini]|uniref:Uncharacterized protein n=1 Tax=Soboliphyme baturini TaxID=241478 RepID=A0A183I9D8_9BILA|nr:unnamed protein product [Soboliphyme baturini]
MFEKYSSTNFTLSHFRKPGSKEQGQEQMDDAKNRWTLWRFENGRTRATGVTVLLPPKMKSYLFSVARVSDRLMTCQMLGKHGSIASLLRMRLRGIKRGGGGANKDQFCDCFQVAVSRLSQHDLTVVSDDLNPQDGSDQQ